MKKSTKRPVHGWVVVDKPVGPTSTQVLGKVRWLLSAAKGGHAGTLDPLASGILPLAFGEATKTLPYAVDATKTYRFEIRFGIATATDDAEGAVTATSAVRPDDAALRAALPGFLGTIAQRPPAYSAIKIQGERAYDLARKGVDITLPARPVDIHDLRLIARPDADHALIEVGCGKGTYVRSLARDLSLVLGTVGHVSLLRRTRVGPFDESRAFSLETIENFVEKTPDFLHNSLTDGILLPLETALDDIPALAVREEDAQALRQGRAIRIPSTVQSRGEGAVVRLSDGSRLVALGQWDDPLIRPVRVFNL